MIKQLILAHLLLTIFGAIPWFLGGDAWQNSLSWIVGAMVVNVNLVAISWAWNLVLEKKLIALAVSIIVIKYALIAGLLYIFVGQSWFKALAFGAGVASFMIVLAGATMLSRKNYVL